jgi:hypothetical protein
MQSDFPSPNPQILKKNSIFIFFDFGGLIDFMFSTKLKSINIKFLIVSWQRVPSGNLNSIVFLLNFVLEATK